MKPIRIQRRRTRGWRMPRNTVYVGRGSRYGNPWRVATVGRDEAVRRFACIAADVFGDCKELRGKNLCCWCALDQPCHADVLLEIANRSNKDVHGL